VRGVEVLLSKEKLIALIHTTGYREGSANGDED
jgi:hypothetical protein